MDNLARKLQEIILRQVRTTAEVALAEHDLRVIEMVTDAIFNKIPVGDRMTLERKATVAAIVDPKVLVEALEDRGSAGRASVH